MANYWSLYPQNLKRMKSTFLCFLAVSFLNNFGLSFGSWFRLSWLFSCRLLWRGRLDWLCSFDGFFNFFFFAFFGGFNFLNKL
jgi:hypothetical protein